MILLLGAGGVVVASACGLYGIPMVARLGEQRQLRERARRMLVLTYDDGPGPQLTQSLRQLLATHGAKATFFLLGSRAAAAPDVVSGLQADGHELGCHTHDHRHAWKTSPWRTLSDMNKGYTSMGRWLAPSATFRPPYGKMVFPTWWAARRRGARLAWWTIDSGDTHAQAPAPQSVADAVARAGGGVVLMHDFDRPAQWADRGPFVLRTTELLLDTAKKEGLTVCRYSDLWQPAATGAAMLQSQQ